MTELFPYTGPLTDLALRFSVGDHIWCFTESCQDIYQGSKCPANWHSGRISQLYHDKSSVLDSDYVYQVRLDHGCVNCVRYVPQDTDACIRDGAGKARWDKAQASEHWMTACSDLLKELPLSDSSRHILEFEPRCRQLVDSEALDPLDRAHQVNFVTLTSIFLNVYHDVGRFTEAIDLFRDIRALVERLDEERTRELGQVLATNLNCIGCVFQTLQQYSEALAVFQEGIDLVERAPSQNLDVGERVRVRYGSSSGCLSCLVDNACNDAFTHTYTHIYTYIYMRWVPIGCIILGDFFPHISQ